MFFGFSQGFEIKNTYEKLRLETVLGEVEMAKCLEGDRKLTHFRLAPSRAVSRRVAPYKRSHGPPDEPT